MRLIYLPSPGGKNLAAPISTLAAVLRGFTLPPFDLWFFVNVGMGHHCALARLSGRPVVMNVDGLDWQRAKWGPVARAYFRSAAQSAVRYCSELVTDCDAMRDYYLDTFARESTVIAYGADITAPKAPERIGTFGVRPGEYYLVVSRLVPENSLDLLLDAYRQSRTARPLLVVGDANYRDAFHRRLRTLAASDARIRLVGGVYDQSLLEELWCNCTAYLHGHSVGGTNPALLRAMGCGACVLALDTVFNREALGDAGLYFPANAADIARQLDRIDGSPLLADDYRRRAPLRVAAQYTWERITDQYETLFEETERAWTARARSDDVQAPARATPLAALQQVPADPHHEAPLH